MYFWEPGEGQMAILFVIAGLWGVADAVWGSQVVGNNILTYDNDHLVDCISATYIVLYSDNDSSAIAKYRFWKSVGSLLGFGFAGVITIHLALILLFASVTVSMIFYSILEIHVRCKNNRKKSDAVNDHC
ncbi:unnamed protein product [Rotaria sordida]|uniref:Uncharacterized protein n=1 Tax=Rotaria sordida TaxID=392033 RepID=A0A819IDB8_9BILA|nr:unnamed protein product [Rotaria sordida]CAF1403404.1 unnamed protein product [Rotaria sordida]CAF3911171.1 unnamed protein product [Rotaria sordida]CAF3933377.1 unnamed protein product [Rotaria sordida]